MPKVYYSSFVSEKAKNTLDEKWKKRNNESGGQDAWIKSANRAGRRIVNLLKSIEQVEGEQEKVDQIKGKLDSDIYPVEKPDMSLAEALFFFCAQERRTIAKELGHSDEYGVPRERGRKLRLKAGMLDSQWDDMQDMLTSNKGNYPEIKDESGRVTAIKLGKGKNAGTLAIDKVQESKEKSKQKDISYSQLTAEGKVEKGSDKIKEPDIWDYISSGDRKKLKLNYPDISKDSFKAASKSLDKLLSKETTGKKALRAIGEVSYNMVTPIALKQGSAAAAEFMFSALLSYKGLTVPQRKKEGAAWDVRALLLPSPASFARNFENNIFVTKPKELSTKGNATQKQPTPKRVRAGDEALPPQQDYENGAKEQIESDTKSKQTKEVKSSNRFLAVYNGIAKFARNFSATLRKGAPIPLPDLTSDNQRSEESKKQIKTTNRNAKEVQSNEVQRVEKELVDRIKEKQKKSDKAEKKTSASKQKNSSPEQKVNKSNKQKTSNQIKLKKVSQSKKSNKTTETLPRKGSAQEANKSEKRKTTSNNKIRKNVKSNNKKKVAPAPLNQNLKKTTKSKRKAPKDPLEKVKTTYFGEQTNKPQKEKWSKKVKKRNLEQDSKSKDGNIYRR